MLNKKVLFAGVLLGLLALNACHKSQQKDQSKVVTAQLKPVTTDLYFTATVQPLHITPVTCLSDGVIEKQYFNYGKAVKNDSPLFLLKSEKLEDEYHAAFSDYIKAKQGYENQRIKFKDTQELWQALIIPRQSYVAEKAALATSSIAFIRAENKLQKLIKIRHIAAKALQKISANNMQQVKKIITTPYDLVTIDAPSAGVALFPVASGAGKAAKKVEVGSAVKKDQVLLNLGDLSGLQFNFKVKEININKIKSGSKVTIIGDAFPGELLQGEIAAVDAQAEQAENNGLATFQVRVVVPKITAKQRQLVHVGMTATIKLTLHDSPKIMVPINAVYQKLGLSMVKVKNPNDDKVTEVPVVTGRTTANEVVITHGLKENDQVMIA